MKKIYWSVLVTFLLSLFFYMGQVIAEVYNLTLPEAKATIEVVDWDKSKSATQIYQTLEEFSKTKKLPLYKVTFGTSDDGSMVKNVYYFPSNKPYHYDDSSFEDKVQFKKSSDLTIENPLGSYYLTSSLPKELVSVFKDLGLEVTTSSGFMVSVLAQFFANDLGGLLIFLGLILFVIDVFVFISQSKKLGILALHGRSSLLLAVFPLRFELPLVIAVVAISIWHFPLGLSYFLVLVAIVCLWLGLSHILSLALANHLTTIVEKIKAKKPYKKLLFFNVLIKLLSILVCALSLSQGLADIDRLGKMEKAIAVWQKLPNYLVLNFSSDTSLFPTAHSSQKEIEARDEKARKIVSDLLSIGEETGAVLAESVSSEQAGFSYMVVNHQFLKDIAVYRPDGGVMGDFAKDSFHLIIPENLRKQQVAIEKTMREVIAFHQNVSADENESYVGEIDVTFSRSGQRVFNFNTSDFTQTQVDNPVILVANPVLFGEKVNALVGEMSQGHYLFQEKETVMDYIETHHLTEDFAGLTSGRELGLSKLRQVRSQFYLRLVGVVMSVLVFVVINYFLIMTYLESQKKKLVIWYLFGKSYLTRHKPFLIAMFCLPVLPLVVVMALGLVSLPIVAGILVMDVVMYSSFLLLFEKRERLVMLKQGE